MIAELIQDAGAHACVQEASEAHESLVMHGSALLVSVEGRGSWRSLSMHGDTAQNEAPSIYVYTAAPKSCARVVKSGTA
jgi:hypothetical protein